MGNLGIKIFMLIGEYIHTLDEKNRVSLPAKFRKEMGGVLIIAPGLDNCLFLFSKEEWNRVSGVLSHRDSELSFLRADERSFNRNLFGRASDVEVDSIGRILIPTFLKEKISLKNEAVLVGVGDRVEIWNKNAWREYLKVAEKNDGAIAEKLAGEK